MSIAAPSGTAFAQQSLSTTDLAQARDLLNQGLKLRKNGDSEGAIEKLRAAHALVETPITGTELGRTYLALGKLVEAREAFLSVGRIAHRAEETSRSAAARAESAQLAEEIRSRLSSITVKVAGAIDKSFRVTVDGRPLPLETLAVPHSLNPGSHKLVVQPEEGTAAEVTVDLREGESREVELKLPLPAVATPADATIDRPFHAQRPASGTGQTQRVAGLVIAGVGIAGLGAGGVLALVAKSQDNAAATEPFPAKHRDSLDASHLADAATIVVGAGALLAVGGGVVWFTAPRTDMAVGTNGSTIWLRRSF